MFIRCEHVIKRGGGESTPQAMDLIEPKYIWLQKDNNSKKIKKKKLMMIMQGHFFKKKRERT